MKKLVFVISVLLITTTVFANGRTVSFGATFGMNINMASYEDWYYNEKRIGLAMYGTSEFPLPGSPFSMCLEIGLCPENEIVVTEFPMIGLIKCNSGSLVEPINLYLGGGGGLHLFTQGGSYFGINGIVGMDLDLGAISLFSEFGYGKIFFEGDFNFEQIAMQGGIKINLFRTGTARKRRRPRVIAKKEKIYKAPTSIPTYTVSPPRLNFSYNLTDEDGNMILDGGERINLSVKVSNNGKGKAEGVKVLLSGENQALRYLGSSKFLGDIAAGEEKEAVFETFLPYQINAEDGKISIKVTEEKGFGALKEAELLVAIQPPKLKKESKIISKLVDVDQPFPASEFKRKNSYAVIISISDYRSEIIPEIKYASRDAEMMKEYLINVCGIPGENIIYLSNDKATLSDLTAYIEEWLLRKADKESLIFVYFAGHGTPNPEKGDAYLVPFDGEPGFVSKLYSLKRLYGSLEKLPSEEIVVVLDACFSGAGGRSVIEKGKRPLSVVKLEEASRNVSNIAIMTASSDNEISQDLDNMKHGLFTYYFLKGLRGYADSNGDGWITLIELYNYCKPNVYRESRSLGYSQTPKLFPAPIGSKGGLKIGKVIK
jgi:hypothetical protein